MIKPLRIAIVGAGPAGLAAALYLHRSNHQVTVFERFAEAAPVGSGLILQPTGLTVLEDLGLFAAIAQLGSRIDRLYGADAHSNRTVLDVRYSAIKGGRHGIAVHRAALFHVLFEAVQAERIAVETGLDVDTLETRGDLAWLVSATQAKAGPFDLVVDASGSRSRLKTFALQPSEPKPLVYGAFWASLQADPAALTSRALVQRYHRATTMIGVLPIGKAHPDSAAMSAFFWSTKPDEVETLKRAGINRWKDQVAGLWPDCESYLQQINDFDDMTLARYGHHTLAMPVGRSLAVIGDAAHSTSPQLGQGANMALLDARALVHALNTSPDLATALPRYAASRRVHVRTFQALSGAFTPFYQSDSRLLPLLRDRVMATVAKIPPAPQILASMVAGTLVDPFAPIGLRERSWQEPLVREAHPT
ncbi:FAD-dependent oxidoreductase [Pseudomonas turukhanskensis]|uniref:Glutamate synthase n=1 Tax=Pseudomonas turukhanskensis TaxID=1806536 RepID=A0A9W6K235_9PSED|nr:NAD(P)/FAD-dependent oxidoreductase [Pseudomonas turukhanskensis]GLK88125.1 glutamate synthase [Pseudomonas turukhanskensis]